MDAVITRGPDLIRTTLGDERVTKQRRPVSGQKPMCAAVCPFADVRRDALKGWVTRKSLGKKCVTLADSDRYEAIGGLTVRGFYFLLGDVPPGKRQNSPGNTEAWCYSGEVKATKRVSSCRVGRFLIDKDPRQHPSTIDGCEKSRVDIGINDDR